jgi:hypothetical protein
VERLSSLETFRVAAERARALGPKEDREALRAIGALVYRSLTGCEPGDPRQRPSQLEPSLPEALDRWWLRTAGRRRDDSFRSAKELMEALAEALAVPAEERAMRVRDLTPTPVQMPSAFATTTDEARRSATSPVSWAVAALAIPLSVAALLWLARP